MNSWIEYNKAYLTRLALYYNLNIIDNVFELRNIILNKIEENQKLNLLH